MCRSQSAQIVPFSGNVWYAENFSSKKEQMILRINLVGDLSFFYALQWENCPHLLLADITLRTSPWSIVVVRWLEVSLLPPYGGRHEFTQSTSQGMSNWNQDPMCHHYPSKDRWCSVNIRLQLPKVYTFSHLCKPEEAFNLSSVTSVKGSQTTKQAR
jgi:hypothetical protein